MQVEIRGKKGITIVSLVVTIIILIILAGISINTILGDNGIITIAKKTKENMELAQIAEQTKLNELYMQIEKEEGTLENNYVDFLEKINEFKRRIGEYINEAGGIKPEYTANVETFGESILGIVREVTKDATALPEDITSGKTAYVNGEKITGIMPTLESQTQATATEGDILEGKTAWVNGNKITGTNKDNNSYSLSAYYAPYAQAITRIDVSGHKSIIIDGFTGYNKTLTCNRLLIKKDGIAIIDSGRASVNTLNSGYANKSYDISDATNLEIYIMQYENSVYFDVTIAYHFS